MPPKRSKKPPQKHEEDSLSEDVDDDTEEAIATSAPQKRPRPDTSLQWIDKYEPTRVEDLCLNPRKLREVSDVLESMIAGKLGCRLLVLSGPAGSSKSTSVKLLAKKHLQERSARTGGSMSTSANSIIEYFDSKIEDTYQKDQFRDFMDGCKFLVGNNLSVILIEDLPNIFYNETLYEFRDCLRNWVFSDANLHLPPVVLCLLEIERNQSGEPGQKAYYNIENNLTVETLLGRDFFNLGAAQGTIKRIKFLPIAKTFMKKTLNKIISKELQVFGSAKKKDLDEFLNGIIETGDIRSLICNLQFWSMYGLHSPSDRENQISLFHAVGKVIHSSSKFAGLDEQQSDALSIKMVADAYSNFSLLHLTLLENYQIVNGADYDVNIAAQVVDSLSINDTLEGVEESQEYGIMATRASLRQVPVKSGRTQPMKFSRHFKTIRESNKVRREVSDYVRYVSRLRLLFQEANLVDGCLLPRIYNLFRYRLLNGRTRYNYNRLGGTFAQIFADEELPVMEDESEFVSGAEDQFKADIRQKIKEENEGDEGSDDEVMSDAVDDSTGETDDDLNDTFDDGNFDNLLSSMRTQTTTKPKETKNKELEDILDDPELDLLVSQGML